MSLLYLVEIKLTLVPCSDYIENRKLDAYDATGLNDDEDFSDDADARRAAEERMDRRDRRQLRAAGAAGERRRARMPGFLASEEEDSEDEGQLLGRRRVRRLYDEPYGDDDAGFDEVRPASSFSSSSMFDRLTSSSFRRAGNADRAAVRHPRRLARPVDRGASHAQDDHARVQELPSHLHGRQQRVGLRLAHHPARPACVLLSLTLSPLLSTLGRSRSCTCSQSTRSRSRCRSCT